MKKILSFLLLISIFTSCTFEVIEDFKAVTGEILDDNGAGMVRVQGISDETLSSIPLDAGEIGIAIDARKLAVLGYKPTTVSVVIDGELSNFTQTSIPVDPFTHVAIFKLPRKDLTEAQLFQFNEGVPITVSVLDADNVILETLSSTKFVVQDGSNNTWEIETSRKRILPEIKINPDIAYYLKQSNSGATYLGFNNALPVGTTGKLVMTRYANDSLLKKSKIQKFYFIPIEGEAGVFKIKTAYDNSYLEVSSSKLLYDKNNKDPNFVLENKHKFTLEQTPQGSMTIKSLNKTTVYNESIDLLAADIIWEFDDLGTEYSAAIMPPAQQDFAFDQTINNCSSATGEYYVGTNKEESTTTSISFTEIANFYSNTVNTESATVTAKASGSLFGIGVEASGSGTLEASSTSGFGTESTSNKAKEFKVSQIVSSNRLITVPPYTSIEVFDVIQKLSNVRIPFVQRTLLRGTDDKGIPLSGEEIASQLGANRFGGVVIEVGSDYIEFSVRGTVNIANYFKYQNTVNDIVGICN